VKGFRSRVLHFVTKLPGINRFGLKQETGKAVDAISQAIKLIWVSSPRLVVFRALLNFLQGILPLGVLYSIKLLVDLLSEQKSALIGNGEWKRVIFLVLLSGLFMLLDLVCRSLAGMVSTRQSDRVLDKMTSILHEHSIAVDLSFYEHAGYYDALHRAQQEAVYRPLGIIDGLFSLLQALITIVAITGLIISVNWSIALILFLALLPAFIVKVLFSKKNFSLQHRQTQAKRHLGYLNALLTSEIFAKELRLFSLGSFFVDQYKNVRSKQRQENLELTDRETIFGFLGQFIALLSLIASLSFLLFRSLSGALSIGSLVMIYQAMQRAQSSTQSLLNAVAALYRDSLFFSSFDEFLQQKPLIVSPPESNLFPVPIAHGITFNNVSFHYPGTDRQVLKNFSLTIRPGEHVALVGENGCGKTTLVKLLCRLYEPDEGQILIDGIDYRMFDLDDLRKRISVIFQDYVRYHMSGRDNIRMGNIEISNDDILIEQAARRSGAHEVLERLENGYDNILGNLFDGGHDLSLGEWQKIAIARSFLRDAPIMILDEPTSSLDVEAEYELFQQFDTLTKGKAALIISHRLSTVRMADCIVVLSAGKIAEKGSHEELMQADSMYARLYRMQSGLYK